MFYTDEDLVNKLNEVYTNVTDTGTQLRTPSMDEILLLLNDRKPILFFYLTSEYDQNDSKGEVPTVNMKLLEFFAFPIGDHIWSTDPSLKFLSQDDYLKIRDSFNQNIIVKMGHYKTESYQEFVDKLNKQFILAS